MACILGKLHHMLVGCTEPERRTGFCALVKAE